MRRIRFLLSALFLGAVATGASAHGIASLTWDTCSPGAHDKPVAPGASVAWTQLYVSVINHSTPHDGYEVQVEFGSPSPGIRDAWRFDTDGCQGPGFLSIEHIPPAAFSKVCPPFTGRGSVLQIKTYTYDSATGRTTGLLANAYPGGNPNGLNPEQRYLLARFAFDHTSSVHGPTTPGTDCGGLEVPVCGSLRVAKFNALGSGEIPWVKGQDFITANDPNNTSNCPLNDPDLPIPATGTTWGSVKAQYKH